MVAPLGRVTGVLGCGYPGVRKGRFWKACIRHYAHSAEAAGASLGRVTGVLGCGYPGVRKGRFC